MLARLPLLLSFFFAWSLIASAPGFGQSDDRVEFTSMSTSLFVMGDTSAVPLDDGSLNALFTSAFEAEVGKALAESLGSEIDYNFTPAKLQLQYLSTDKGAKDGRVAKLYLSYKNLPDDLYDKLQVEAPKVALDLLRERVYGFLNNRHDLQQSQFDRELDMLRRQREDLSAELEHVQKRLTDMATDAIESAESLEQNYRQLKERQRDDRMRELSSEAQREAVEKRLAEYRALSEEIGGDSPLVEELKSAAEARQATLKLLRKSIEGKSKPIELLEQVVEQNEEAVAVAEAQHNRGIGSAVKELPNARASLAEARVKLENAKAELKISLAQAEAEAMQGRIAYLQALEKARQDQFGNQIEKLNAMLTDLALRADEVNARRDAIERELDLVAAQIRQQKQTDFKKRQLAREAAILDEQLRHIERQLFDVEVQRNRPAEQEFAILPWGG